MKKFVLKIIVALIAIIPLNVFAAGYINASPTSLTIEKGSSKTFTITAYNSIGDVTINSNNSSIAGVNTSSWETGMVEEGITKTGTITVTGSNVGSTTIRLVVDGATFDGAELSNTITINVTVTAKPTTTTTTTTTRRTTTSTTTRRTTTSTTTRRTTSTTTRRAGTTTTTKAGTTTTTRAGNTTTTTVPNGTTTTTVEPTIKIDVIPTSAPGKTKSYPPFTDNTLNSLSIEGFPINFIRSLYTYNIVVGEDINNLLLNYELTNKSYKVVVTGNENFQNGLNVVKISVTDNDGDTLDYVINVYKGLTNMNHDGTLKSIKIKNYEIDFKPNVYNYDLNIRNDDHLELDILPNAATTTYQISGNEDLVDGKVITIKTIAQDNSSIEYNITIHFDIDVMNPLLIIIPLIVIIILVVVYFIVRRNKRKSKMVYLVGNIENNQ